jgi:hypothetical protein
LEEDMEIPVATMTLAEKLAAMEQLWSSLQVEPENPPPAWHREVLAERQRRIDRGEATFSTLDEVRDLLRRRE